MDVFSVHRQRISDYSADRGSRASTIPDVNGARSRSLSPRGCFTGRLSASSGSRSARTILARILCTLHQRQREASSGLSYVLDHWHGVGNALAYMVPNLQQRAAGARREWWPPSPTDCWAPYGEHPQYRSPGNGPTRLARTPLPQPHPARRHIIRAGLNDPTEWPGGPVVRHGTGATATCPPSIPRRRCLAQR